MKATSSGTVFSDSSELIGSTGLASFRATTKTFGGFAVFFSIQVFLAMPFKPMLPSMTLAWLSQAITLLAAPVPCVATTLGTTLAMFEGLLNPQEPYRPNRSTPFWLLSLPCTRDSPSHAGKWRIEDRGQHIPNIAINTLSPQSQREYFAATKSSKWHQSCAIITIVTSFGHNSPTFPTLDVSANCWMRSL